MRSLDYHENTPANNVLMHQCFNYIWSMSNIRGLVLWSCAINIKEATTLFISPIPLHIYLLIHHMRLNWETCDMYLIDPGIRWFSSPFIITGDVSADRGVWALGWGAAVLLYLYYYFCIILCVMLSCREMTAAALLKTQPHYLTDLSVLCY